MYTNITDINNNEVIVEGIPHFFPNKNVIDINYVSTSQQQQSYNTPYNNNVIVNRGKNRYISK